MKGWSVEDIFAHVTKNLEILPIENEDNAITGAWKGFATVRGAHSPEGSAATTHCGSAEIVAKKLSSYFNEPVGPKLVISVAQILSMEPKRVRSPKRTDGPGYVFEDIAKFLAEMYTAPLPLTSGTYKGYIEIRTIGKVRHGGSTDRIRRTLGRGFFTVASAIERHQLKSRYFFMTRGRGAHPIKMHAAEDIEEAIEKDQNAKVVE